MATSINIIYDELAKLEQFIKTRLPPLPKIQEHIGHVKQTIRARLENGTLQPHEVTLDSIAYQGRLLESESLDVYDYLKGLDLL